MKLHPEDNVIDFHAKIRKRIEILKKIFSNEEALTRIASIMIPHVECQDEHGHSQFISMRVHPAQYMEIAELYEKHNIKFPHKSDYLRYLLTVGLIIDKYYWSLGDKDGIGDILHQLMELQKQYAQIALQQQLQKVKQKMEYIKKKSGGKHAINADIDDTLRRLEEL